MPVKVGLKYIEIWKDSMENAVQAYEAQPLEKGQIVFYGPSNFTRWDPKYGMKPLRECVLGDSGKPCAVNRGFGSSCSEHQLYYYHRMVKPLEPKVLVYYCPGNYEAFGYSAKESWELAQRVIIYTLTDFPDCRIYLSGFNPKRDMNEKYLRDREWQNAEMKKFCEETPNCTFFDPFDFEPLMRKDIFIKDGVHFSQEGYDLYAEFMKKVLKDELKNF